MGRGTRCRLAEVERLLADPSEKIGSIAAHTGYCSENFLPRLFKRKTGLSPSRWRAAMTRKRQGG